MTSLFWCVVYRYYYQVRYPFCRNDVSRQLPAGGPPPIILEGITTAGICGSRSEEEESLLLAF